MMSAEDTNIDYQRQHFEAFSKECYANQNDKMSKTILKDKGQKRLNNSKYSYKCI